MTDSLELALAEETVDAIQTKPYAAVTSSTSIAEAVHQLANLEIACVLVMENGKLTGIFSNRDVLDKVADRFHQVKDHPVSEVTTSNPIFVYESDSAAAALHVMAVSGYRHVPVVDVNDQPVGIVSPQRVLEFLRQHFDSS